MKILIMGAGKSGTTAVAYGLSQKLPDYNMIFEPSSLGTINYQQNNFIVKSVEVKKWKKEQQYFDLFDKKILIVRHPFDRIISYLLYIPYNGWGFSCDKNTQKYISLLEQKTKNPNSLDTLEIIDFLNKITKLNMIEGLANEHEMILELYQEQSRYFQILKYENFIDGKLNDLENYLQVKIEDKIEVGSKHKRVARTKGYGDWLNWLTQKDLEIISPKFNLFNLQFGYQHTYQGELKKEIDPEHSYKYTINVINEYRKKRILPSFEKGIINIGEEGVLVDLAIDNIKRNKLLEAREAIEKSITLNPNLIGLYFIKANILFKQGNFSEAEQAVSHVIKFNPDVLPAQKLKQNILSCMSNYSY